MQRDPCVFRGESRHFPRIATKLYRRLTAWHVPLGQGTELRNNLVRYQRRLLQEMGEFVPALAYYDQEQDQYGPELDILLQGMRAAAHRNPQTVEMLCRLQHFGGTTNLLDFTTDYLVALFFACIHHETQDGRVIFLPHDITVWKPTPTDHRILVQKSCLYWPLQGEITLEDPCHSVVTVPARHKPDLLQYLYRCHSISPATIYPDLHGAISWSELLETEDETWGPPSAFWRQILDEATGL